MGKKRVVMAIIAIITASAVGFAADGKRMSKLRWPDESVTLHYDDQDRLVRAQSSRFGSMTYSYSEDGSIIFKEFSSINLRTAEFSGDYLTQNRVDETEYAIEWMNGVPVYSKGIFKGTYSDHLDEETTVTYYDVECNVPALSFAFDLMAVLWGFPDDLSSIYHFCALAPYMGTLPRKLVKSAHHLDYVDEEVRVVTDVTFTYEFDDEGYVTLCNLHIVENDSNASHIYEHDEPIHIEWEPTTGVQDVVQGTQGATEIYTLDGKKASRLQRGVNIVRRGSKVVKVAR